MEEIKIEWGAYSPAEKLIAIDAYLDGMAKLDDADEALNNERLEWLRAHLPAYDPKGGKNYIFISYSHLDYKSVYRDLAYFSYNSQRRVRFWYDEGLPVGKDWEAAAGKFMADKHCVGVIFYLSKNLLLSPSVFKEIQAVKKYNKPYFAVALNGGEYSAAKIFDNALGKELRTVKERQGELEEFFPDNHTAETYYKDTAFARINKISQFFDVTEEVFADFEVEDCKGGLILKKYLGDKSDIRIPEKIDGKPIVEISSKFFECKANTVFIPKTVKSIRFPEEVYGNKYFNFESFIVDKENTVYCDINGVLCTKTGTLLRAPKRWFWGKQFAADYPKARYKTFLYMTFEDLKYFANAVFGEEVRSNKVQISIDEFSDIMSYCAPNGENKYIDARDNKSIFYECCLELKQKSLFKGIKSIAEKAFFGCKNIAFMFIPDTIKTFKESAFEHSNLKLICLSENLNIIPEKCFATCTQLTTVLTRCDYEKYGNKINLRDALLFGKINKVDSGAFQNTFVEHLVFGENVVTINKFAFLDCYILKSVTFNSIQNLSAVTHTFFYSCGNLHKINFNGTMEEWQKFWNGNPIGIETAKIVCTDGIIPPAEED